VTTGSDEQEREKRGDSGEKKGKTTTRQPEIGGIISNADEGRNHNSERLKSSYDSGRGRLLQSEIVLKKSIQSARPQGKRERKGACADPEEPRLMK